MNNIYIYEKEKGNPKIDPRVAAHDASYLMDISESHFFIIIMYVNHFSIINCEQHPFFFLVLFFFFFCCFHCVSLTTLNLYI